MLLGYFCFHYSLYHLQDACCLSACHVCSLSLSLYTFNIKFRKRITPMQPCTSIPYVRLRGVSEKIKRICSCWHQSHVSIGKNTQISLLTMVKPRNNRSNRCNGSCVPHSLYGLWPYKHWGDMQNAQCMTKGTSCNTVVWSLNWLHVYITQHTIEEDHRIDWSNSTVAPEKLK